MPGIANDVSGFFKDRLAHRLSIYFIGIAILCSVCVVAIASYIQYQRDIESIDKDVQQVVNTIEEQITSHLWDVDEDSLTLLLEGVNRLPVVSGVDVSDEFGQTFTFGSHNAKAVIDKLLLYDNQKVGAIKVYPNSGLAMDELRNNILYASVGAVLIFILLGFIFFIIVKRTITDHLSAISKMTVSPEYYQQQADFEVSLDRQDRNDELSNLVNALNIGLNKSRALADAQRVYESQLLEQAYVDDLTDMPNRRDADQYIAQKMEGIQSGQTQQYLMTFFIDLDGFKEVNDSLGHTVGDGILLESSKRFKKVVEKYDGYIARFGGDEFLGCIDCESHVKGELIAQRLIDEVARQFHIENMVLTLSCSMGVVFCPEHATSSEDVIRKADAAMYRAKELGRNCFVIYDEEIMRSVLLQSNIKQRIKKALCIEDSLEVYYQPLINIKENKIIGFEALLRWQDDVLGKVSPEIFVPVAEKSGLIFDIDIMVFDHAMQQVGQWRQDFSENYKVSINFSPTNFENNRIIHWLNNKIVPRVDLEWVEIEVTERLMLVDNPFVKESLGKIADSGVRLSLDDFGTGFSSLGYIKKFNKVLSKIKIDRLFVSEIMHSEADLALVKSIVTMAESLNIEWLAEGVETQEQLDKLASLGCEFVQGFHYAKPMSAPDVETFIAEWGKEHA